ncbi:hypothetical protein BGX26_001311 [Mortierella sp. AD094]|nr:hypothetical protein BGX26_001311 [Mortierella sp. AD094]
MLSLTPALGLLCLLFGPASTLAAPASHLTERSFNPRQRWQRDEVNCVRILNPAPGATYHPDYFVRLSYGTEQCNGATAAGPWSIHLYNNPEIEQGGKIRFDYHEVIADGLNEYKTQYVWNIPANQQSMTKKVRKSNDYYVRIETSSHDGTKLVGNAGPFSISPDQLSRRADEAVDPILNAEFALKPHDTPLVFPDEPVKDVQAPAPVKDTVTTPEVLTVTVPETPAVAAPVVPAASSILDTPLPDKSAPNVATQIKIPKVSKTPASRPPPTSESLGLTDNTAPKPPITEIPRTSFIPNSLLVGGAVAAGALGLGIVGGSFFGTVGTIVGSVLGGVLGCVAVLLSLLNPYSY